MIFHKIWKGFHVIDCILFEIARYIFVVSMFVILLTLCKFFVKKVDLELAFAKNVTHFSAITLIVNKQR